MAKGFIKFYQRKSLKQSFVESMFELYQKYYDTTKEDFLFKMQTIDEYALYFYFVHGQEKLVGFTGIRRKKIDVERKKFLAFYFGQTVIEKEYRGKRFIQNTVLKMTIMQKLKAPWRELIFWNDSLSYRPYLIMAKSLKVFYPNPHLDTPDKSEHNQFVFKQVADKLGHAYYGHAYDQQTGTIVKDKLFLKKNEHFIGEEEKQDPLISYYLKKNKYYTRGDGLITLCPANWQNFSYYVYHRIVKGFRRG